MERIEKTITYRGIHDNEFIEKTETVYFRELTAGDRLQITKGQSVKATPGVNKATMEVELGDMMERKHRLVQLTLVTSEGKQVYPQLRDLQKETDNKIKALIKVAEEINKDDSEGAADAGKS